jgi:hypothetical protein
VFESPLRLDLQLECNADTSVEKTLNVWPRLPIIINDLRQLLPLRGANIIAALEHHDLVCQIALRFTPVALLRKLYKVMKKPYPMLTDLHLEFESLGSAPSAPDSFLGGSAPRLRNLILCRVPFPALPKLLLSCHNLVDLQLNIPDNGYIHPEAMATALSALTKLEALQIQFSSRSRLDQITIPPETCVVLPALTLLRFHGATKYLEDLVARIHTPSVSTVQTELLPNHDFNLPYFVQFIGRTQIPGSFQEVKLKFENRSASISFGHHDLPGEKESHILISRRGTKGQVGCIAQLCNNFSPFFSGVDRLQVAEYYRDDKSFHWYPEDYPTGSASEWLELLHAFPAVHHMEILGGIIAPALQELIGERALEVLPMLRHLYLGDSSNTGIAYVPRALEPFISSRQLSGHPVIVHLEKSPV